MERICSYRNCNNNLEGKRVDAKFCCRGCKKMEQTYRKRKQVLIEKYKEIEMKKVEEYKKLMKIVKGDIQN